jgi:hypothetical protein
MLDLERTHHMDRMDHVDHVDRVDHVDHMDRVDHVELAGCQYVDYVVHVLVCWVWNRHTTWIAWTT